VREAARLQTFPDNYYFEGNNTTRYTQVGNAVPPLLACQLAEVVNDILDQI
jgi:DNA (cytosine-5)-methyltransferase 1